jgi:hypothetical protein
MVTGAKAPQNPAYRPTHHRTTSEYDGTSGYVYGRNLTAIFNPAP